MARKQPVLEWIIQFTDPFVFSSYATAFSSCSIRLELLVRFSAYWRWTSLPCFLFLVTRSQHRHAKKHSQRPARLRVYLATTLTVLKCAEIIICEKSSVWNHLYSCSIFLLHWFLIPTCEGRSVTPNFGFGKELGFKQVRGKYWASIPTPRGRERYIYI